jgi:hypothetical protein
LNTRRRTRRRTRMARHWRPWTSLAEEVSVASLSYAPIASVFPHHLHRHDHIILIDFANIILSTSTQRPLPTTARPPRPPPPIRTLSSMSSKLAPSQDRDSVRSNRPILLRSSFRFRRQPTRPAVLVLWTTGHLNARPSVNDSIRERALRPTHRL